MSIPRQPNQQEKQQLVDLIVNNGFADDIAGSYVENAYIAVFDDFSPDFSKSVGKLMTVVWEEGATFSATYTWNDEDELQTIYTGGLSSGRPTELPQFKGYTVDVRLKEFRRIKDQAEDGQSIEFLSFDSDEGDRLLSELIRAVGSKSTLFKRIAQTF